MKTEQHSYLRERFNLAVSQLAQLERTFSEEKTEARLGKLRPGQTPQDLVLIYKKTHRAADLRGDIAEAHRNVMTYALAVLVTKDD